MSRYKDEGVSHEFIQNHQKVDLVPYFVDKCLEYHTPVTISDMLTVCNQLLIETQEVNKDLRTITNFLPTIRHQDGKAYIVAVMRQECIQYSAYTYADFQFEALYYFMIDCISAKGRNVVWDVKLGKKVSSTDMQLYTYMPDVEGRFAHCADFNSLLVLLNDMSRNCGKTRIALKNHYKMYSKKNKFSNGELN